MIILMIMINTWHIPRNTASAYAFKFRASTLYCPKAYCAQKSMCNTDRTVLNISFPQSFLPLLQPLNLPFFLHQKQSSYCASSSPNELQHLQIENHDTLQPRTTDKNLTLFIPRLPARIWSNNTASTNPAKAQFHNVIIGRSVRPSN